MNPDLVSTFHRVAWRTRDDRRSVPRRQGGPISHPRSVWKKSCILVSLENPTSISFTISSAVNISKYGSHGMCNICLIKLVCKAHCLWYFWSYHILKATEKALPRVVIKQLTMRTRYVGTLLVATDKKTNVIMMDAAVLAPGHLRPLCSRLYHQYDCTLKWEPQKSYYTT